MSNSEMSAGENKWLQKPYKVCGILFDYFWAWNKFFNQSEMNKDLINEINDIKNELIAHEKRKKEIIEEGKIIDDEIIAIEQEIRELETRSDNMNHEKLKLNSLNVCFSEYYTLVEEKVNIWKNKKSIVDTILYNFDFYLMLISCYLIYASPLNKFYRKQLKNYLYSISKTLGLENIKEFSICGIIVEFLDETGKDKYFCSAVSQYSEFLADNFTMIYIMNHKIPYLIDSKRISYEIISKFLEKQPEKTIIKANYNDINEIGDMFDKIESSMKNGNELFIDQCEENIYDIFENYIKEKSGYNAKTKKKYYVIKNKKFDKDEKFKLYLINSKSSSKIKPKAFRDCYVINFNCPSDVICGLITDRLCTEQDPAAYKKINDNKKNINIYEFKLLELEDKILNYNKQFDLSGNLDKLDMNKELLEKYKIEIHNYEEIANELEKNKKMLAADFSELFRYQCICTDSTQIYKWCSRLFPLNNLYAFPIDYLSDLVKEFYSNKFGIYQELKGQEPKERKVEKENNSKNDSIVDKDSDNELSHEENIEEEGNREPAHYIPTYTSDNSIEFIIFIYNKISQIYEPNKRKLLLLILLLNALNKREDNSTLFKQLLYETYRIYIKDNINTDKYNNKSPISKISDKIWNSLQLINEKCNYCFSLFLDDIENHKTEWEEYLESDDSLVYSNFVLNNENIESCFTPLTKFAFFSIIRPHLGHSLIDVIISDILNNEENYQRELGLNNNMEYYANLKINKSKILDDLFKENMSISKKPILMFEVSNGEFCLEKELRDYYIKKMKTTSFDNNNNNNNMKQEGNANEHLINYKQIIPSKTELSNIELETVHNSMRTGGVIAIKNCLLVQDSLIKLLDEFKDKNVVINENFKLILLVKTNNLLPKNLYTSTNIIHNDFILLKIMKEYIINLIKETPIDLYNKFMNYDLHMNIMFHLKKIFIYFIIINAILVQYSILNSKMYKIPVDFCKKDFIISLKFIDQYISSINEEKMKALLDPDNSYGFNFDSIIKLSLDNFVNARLIYREDEESVQKMLSQFFEGEQFLRENNNYFNHNGFLVPKLNEKLFPKKKELTPRDEHINVRHSNKSLYTVNISYYIPKDAVVDLFEKIPDEKYYYLLYGVSNDMIYTQTTRIIYDFYNIFSKDSTDETFDVTKTENISYDLPEIFNIKSEIVQLLEDIKKSLPDQLNTADANPILFKVNKFNELFNPLDK